MFSVFRVGYVALNGGLSGGINTWLDHRNKIRFNYEEDCLLSCDLFWCLYLDMFSVHPLLISKGSRFPFQESGFLTSVCQQCRACLYASPPLLRSWWVVKSGVLSRLVGPDTMILWTFWDWSSLSHRAFNLGFRDQAALISGRVDNLLIYIICRSYICTVLVNQSSWFIMLISLVVKPFIIMC